MGDDYVVKLGRFLVKGIVDKSRMVVKKSIAKVFDSRALDRLLEKSTARAVLDHRFSSACRLILAHSSKYPFQKSQYCKEEMVSKEEEEKEELRSVEIDNEEALIPPVPKLRPINSIDNDDVSSSTLAEPIPPCTPEAASKEEEEEDDDDDEEEDDDGVCKRRGEYSSLSEEEFKEMVEEFIERLNERMSQEYNSANRHDS